jgi:hypothetical protein
MSARSGLAPAGSFDPFCAPCEACDGAGACVAAPISIPQCKRPTAAGGARLLVKKSADDPRRRLIWRWATGEVTTLEDFGTPEFDDDYALCVYEALSSTTPRNSIQANLLAGNSPPGSALLAAVRHSALPLAARRELGIHRSC